MKLIFLLFLCFSLNSFSQWEMTGAINTPINAKQFFEYNGVYFLTCQDNYSSWVKDEKVTYISNDTLQNWDLFPLGSLEFSTVFNDTIYVINQIDWDNYGLYKVYLDDSEWKKDYVMYVPTPANQFSSYAFSIYNFYEKNDTLWLVSEGGVYYWFDDSWYSITNYNNSNYPNEVHSYGPDEFGDEQVTYTAWCKSTAQNNMYYFATSYQGIVRSENLDFSDWTILDNGIPTSKSSAIFATDELILAGIKNQIFRSENNGNSWELIESITEQTTINKFFTNNDSIFALTTNGIYFSEDMGTTWSEKSIGLPPNSNVTDIHYTAGDYLIASENGLYRNLENWERVDNIQKSAISQLEHNSNVITARTRKKSRKIDEWGWLDVELFCYKFSYENQLWISENNGDTWVNSTVDLPISRMSNVVVVENRLYMIGMRITGDLKLQTLYASDENGENWEEISTLPHNEPLYSLRSNGENKLAAFIKKDSPTGTPVMGYTLHLSTDTGENWSTSTNTSDLFETYHKIKDILLIDNDIYLSINGKLFKSANLGISWYESGEGGKFNSLFFNSYSLNLFAPLAYNTYYDIYHLYRSETWGESWDQTISYGQNGLITDIDFTNSGIYACTNKKVYYSASNADSWSDFSFGLPIDHFNSGETSSVLIHEDTLYFGSNNQGVWRLPVNEVALGITDKTVEEMKAYPNPFNDVTTIDFGQKQAVNYTTIIYDITGKEIYRKEKINGKQLEISKEELATGVHLLLILNEASIPVTRMKLVVN